MASPRRAMMLSIVGPCSFYFFETSSLVLPIARKRQLPSTQLAWTTLLPRSGLAPDKTAYLCRSHVGRDSVHELCASPTQGPSGQPLHVQRDTRFRRLYRHWCWRLAGSPSPSTYKSKLCCPRPPLRQFPSRNVFFRGENLSCMFIKVSNASTGFFLSVLFRRLRGCPDLCVSGKHRSASMDQWSICNCKPVDTRQRRRERDPLQCCVGHCRVGLTCDRVHAHGPNCTLQYCRRSASPSGCQMLRIHNGRKVGMKTYIYSDIKFFFVYCE